MSSVRKLYGLFERSDGRIRLLTVLGVAGLAAALTVLMVLPAVAGVGSPSDAGVEPSSLEYGGGPGGCAAAGSTYEELHIANPTSDTFTSSDGTVSVTLTVNEDDTEFSYEFSDPAIAAYQVTVNGGPKSLLFDNEAWNWPLTADGGLHAPTKGNSLSNLYKLSHINFCYGEFTPSVSGVKYHDRDTDGILDLTEEEGLGGWTITAFDAQGNVALDANGEDATDTTDSNGNYTLADLVPGTYTICEATNTTGLPSSGTGYTWAWTQSEPDPDLNNLCLGIPGQEPAGHSVTLGGDVTGVDFGNHTQVSIDCSMGDVVVPLGGDGTDDNPKSIVTVPGDCPSGTIVTTYDVGRSDPEAGDPDAWDQFVVFGGDVGGSIVIQQTIIWDAEVGEYVSGSLVVPTTQVVLSPGGTPQDATFCDSVDPAGPNGDLPHCLVNRTIAEGSPLDPGYIQLTENYAFLGDPGFFR